MSDQINAALVSLRDFFQKPLKKTYRPQTLDWQCIFYNTISSFYNILYIFHKGKDYRHMI